MWKRSRVAAGVSQPTAVGGGLKAQGTLLFHQTIVSRSIIYRTFPNEIRPDARSVPSLSAANWSGGRAAQRNRRRQLRQPRVIHLTECQSISIRPPPVSPWLRPNLARMPRPGARRPSWEASSCLERDLSHLRGWAVVWAPFTRPRAAFCWEQDPGGALFSHR